MEWKRREIAPRIRAVPEARALRGSTRRCPRPPSFAAALRGPDGRLAVIAEIKRRSPSAGEIADGRLRGRPGARLPGGGRRRPLGPHRREIFRGLPRRPARRGRLCSGRSRRARPACGRTSWCTRSRCSRRGSPGRARSSSSCGPWTTRRSRALHDAARAAGLDALFEVHTEARDRPRALAHGARLIGVNNRDLAVFKTDLALSERLIPRFPRGRRSRSARAGSTRPRTRAGPAGPARAPSSSGRP